MTKRLKVIKPFSIAGDPITLEIGDEFEFIEDTNEYRNKRVVRHDENNEEFSLTQDFAYSYNISIGYANKLIAEGFLEKIDEKKSNDFVNIFEEMKNIKEEYINQLNNLNTEFAESPMCLKIEKETVLRNLITLLDYLISLKK